ncbi:MAG: hypothetical protein ACRC8S_10915 [Fimbriiglobus sp.]
MRCWIFCCLLLVSSSASICAQDLKNQYKSAIANFEANLWNPAQESVSFEIDVYHFYMHGKQFEAAELAKLTQTMKPKSVVVHYAPGKWVAVGDQIALICSPHRAVILIRANPTSFWSIIKQANLKTPTVDERQATEQATKLHSEVIDLQQQSLAPWIEYVRPDEVVKRYLQPPSDFSQAGPVGDLMRFEHLATLIPTQVDPKTNKLPLLDGHIDLGSSGQLHAARRFCRGLNSQDEIKCHFVYNEKNPADSTFKLRTFSLSSSDTPSGLASPDPANPMKSYTHIEYKNWKSAPFPDEMLELEYWGVPDYQNRRPWWQRQLISFFEPIMTHPITWVIGSVVMVGFVVVAIRWRKRVRARKRQSLLDPS